MRYVQTQIINISKYVNNFLSTNPKTLILSSLVSDFFRGGGGGAGEGGHGRQNGIS